MIVIWILEAVNVVVDLYLFYRAFALYAAGPDAYFIASASFAVDQWAYGVINITYILPSIITDGLLAWRAFVVWARDMRILIFPIFTLVGAFISGFIVVVYDFLAAKNGVLPSYVNKLAYGAYVFYGMNFVVTWYATIAIAIRLYYVGKQTVQFDDRKSNPYRKIILVVVESGLILTVSIFIFSVFYVLGNVYPNSITIYNGYIVLAPIHRRLVGIVPTLLVLQLNLGHVINKGQTATPATNDTSKFAVARQPEGVHTELVFARQNKTGTFADSTLDYGHDAAAMSGNYGPTGSLHEKEEV